MELWGEMCAKLLQHGVAPGAHLRDRKGKARLGYHWPVDPPFLFATPGFLCTPGCTALPHHQAAAPKSSIRASSCHATRLSIDLSTNVILVTARDTLFIRSGFSYSLEMRLSIPSALSRSCSSVECSSVLYSNLEMHAKILSSLQLPPISPKYSPGLYLCARG